MVGTSLAPFIGRKAEMSRLRGLFKKKSSSFIVVRGRRRIGKSSLVSKFTENKHECYNFEAIEGERTPGQIYHFTELLKKQTSDPLLESVHFKTWENVFFYITEKIAHKKPGRKR